MQQLGIYYGSLWYYADQDLPIDYISACPSTFSSLARERGLQSESLAGKRTCQEPQCTLKACAEVLLHQEVQAISVATLSVAV
jgi:hypothetical protein